ncbi:MAG: hypothetical protein HYZ28_15395 [Myxococcales bacterium]|nr:hypothetical protein [Myxococcales bacterium]
MRIVTACISLLLAGVAVGGPARPESTPEPLRPWREWVLHGQEQQACPFLQGSDEESRCVWPSRLALTLDGKAGRFAQSWKVFASAWVPLPGDAKRWPLDVQVDGRSAPIIDREGGPRVYLAPGAHGVTGSFAWDELPESLQVPAETGLLSLSVSGKAIPFPNRDAAGQLWLHGGMAASEPEQLDLRVQRRIEDEVPILLTTRVQLSVSGKNREVLLGKALLPGFVPLSLTSPLPARLEPDGRLRVQARPGKWDLMLVSRHEAPLASLSLPAAVGAWPEEEVWVFDARPHLRVVMVEGATPLDPQQTTLLDDWKRLPAHRMRQGDTLKIAERRRGDSDPAPDALSVHRSLWLDFDGQGFTVQDQISGSLTRSWRLEMRKPTELGHVAVGSADQFITRLSGLGKTDALSGVEIRQGAVQVVADSRVPRTGAMPAVGWDHDFQQVGATLHLPPGWRLFHASGADKVPGTWLAEWSLLDLFLLFIVCVAIGRLRGLFFALLALVAVGLTLKEEGAPQWVWLFVLAGEALVRALPEGRAKGFFRLYRVAAWTVMVMLALPFAKEQIRRGLHPSLEREDASMSADDTGLVGHFAPPARPMAQKGELQSNAIGGLDLGISGSLQVQEGYFKDVETSSNTWRAKSRAGKLDNVSSYDARAAVQTGPGLPHWNWTPIDLTWSGPVQKDQTLSLWLIPPWANLLLAFARVALLAALVLGLAGGAGGVARKLFDRVRFGAAGASAVALLLALVTGGPASAGELPSPEMLQELKARLLKKPECFPSCASSSRLMIEVSGETLRVRVEVSAAAETAVPLPLGSEQWVPSQVLLDGANADGLFRAADGELWIQVSAGSHQVLLEGPLAGRETLQLSLPLPPHRVEAKAEGWRIDGIHEDGLADDNLQLTRVARGSSAEANLQPEALPPFVRVERELTLGLTWEVETRVVRLTPPGPAVMLEIPLLPGESVTTADVRVEKGKAVLNMAPKDTEVSWHSVLSERPKLELVAPKGLPWVELWRLDAGPVWHVGVSGIPVIHRGDQQGDRIREWRPWPGERVAIDVSRPEGIAGQTLTIDKAVLHVAPGLRSTDSTLRLSVRASRGTQHTLTLPAGAELQSATINGQSQPIRQEDRKVTLPVVPGSQEVQLTWRESRGISTRFVSPGVDLGTPSVNVEVQLSVVEGRWTLFTFGPRMGPAVLFWSYLVVLLLAAFGLGRLGLTPLKLRHWVLLGLGLTQVPVWAAGLVAGWLLVLGWRKGRRTEGVFTFNLLQLFIVLLTAGALTTLFGAIHDGLLGSPDMQISGNASTANLLRWFQDRSGPVLPQPAVISAPMLAYRLAMLGWALWLAVSLIGWLRWGWGAFTETGAWRRSPKPPKTPPAPPASAQPPAAQPPSAAA